MPRSRHAAILLHAGNVVYARFGPAAGEPIPTPAFRTCRSCLHWCPDREAPGGGRCLADCGVRIVAPEGRCGAWRRPPQPTVI